MAKWCGKIGYDAGKVEVKPGIWKEQIVERQYFGDTYRNTRLLQNSGNVNDNVNISNQISIVADPYANQHMYEMRYIEFQGTFRKIASLSPTAQCPDKSHGCPTCNVCCWS